MSPSIGPAIPPGLFTRPRPPQAREEEEGYPEKEEEEEDDDDYAPALPPDLLSSRSNLNSSIPANSTNKLVGPSMPPQSYIASIDPRINSVYDDEEGISDDDIGPKPLPSGVSFQEADGVSEFMEKEERRRKQVEEAAKPKPLKRDEWMLVPPTSSDLLGTLDPTKLKPRQFARTQAPAKQVDNSLWTETPAERQQRIADEVSGKKRRAANADDVVTSEEALEIRKRMKKDEEIRKGVEEHTRKVRGATLMDVHSKATSASASSKDEPHVIWDHGRDMSLGGRLMDDKTRKKIVTDAKGLGDRFGTGKGGGFL